MTLISSEASGGWKPEVLKFEPRAVLQSRPHPKKPLTSQWRIVHAETGEDFSDWRRGPFEAWRYAYTTLSLRL